MSETVQPGFGVVLKAAREDRELSIAKVADKLKLTPRQIEAIEAEDLAQLPGPVFVRGFIRNYARLLDLEPQQLIAPVDAQETVSETITAPSEGVTFSTSRVRRWLLLPMLGMVGFIVLVALVYHWLRQGEDALLPQLPATQQTSEVLKPLPVPVAPATLAAPAVSAQMPAPAPLQTAPVTAPSAPEQGMASAAVRTSVPATLVPAQVPAVPAMPATPPQITVAPPAQEIQSSSATAHSLRFEAGHDAWIQVVDGKGRRFSKLVLAGTMETFKGDSPFRLVVGEAAQVRLSFDGHSIDLTPFIGQKVARLTLE